MADRSSIQWTEATWNPVTGCDKVSPGCAHCYAETFAERFRGVGGHPYEQGFDLKLWPDRLNLPLQWKRPRRIFVNSMSDLFHEDVPDTFIREVFAVMERATWHTFQILTKRHRRLGGLARELPWPPNVWIGVSVENRRYVNRADSLRTVPASVRFISAEPLLGPLEGLDLSGLQWVIAGGESGPSARPMHPRWAIDLRDQCRSSGVPFFFKQWGAFAPLQDLPSGAQGRVVTVRDSRSTERWDLVSLRRVGKGRAGRTLEGRTWDEYPMLALA